MADAKDEDLTLHILSNSDAKDATTANGMEDTTDTDDDFDRSSQGRKLFFNDGVRRIDYILAWDTKVKKTNEAQNARRAFHENLKNEGLHLEYDESDPEIHFAKIHAPLEVLSCYAETLKIRMPMTESLSLKHFQGKYQEQVFDTETACQKLWDNIKRLFKKLQKPFDYDQELFPPIKKKFCSAYTKDKSYLFDIPENKELFFSNSLRSKIVDYILRRLAFKKDTNHAYSFGIKKMLSDGYYCAAFPLHEGHWKKGSAQNRRKLLYDNWAHWRKLFTYQPLNNIREYFGEKIGIYFTWLGFYTLMLVPASLVGLAVFIYGLVVSDSSPASMEICNSKNSIIMCPLCDLRCPYWNLSQACSHAKASLIVDNGATVFFAIFMSLWGTLFLEFWKRKEAVIQYKWNLLHFEEEEEPPRPEYLAKLSDCKKYKIHAVTKLKEPYLSFWGRQIPAFFFSYSSMLFMVTLAIVAVIGVIAFRVSTLAALHLQERKIIYKNASLVTTLLAALINLAIIIILNIIYRKAAFWLTDLECLRTQREYDNSLTLKLFLLQFVNYYSSIIYIAFFKGKLVGRPGKYNTIFGARQEECEPGGCLIELCIQLAIIMVGKQLIQNNLMEIVLPKLWKFLLKRWKVAKDKKIPKTPWEKDRQLQEVNTTTLFYEYLEMVLQFGFLTLFVSAFPLGPLFCFINNILEIRCDANKFVTQLRRPTAQRCADIGIWHSVLYGISRIAVVSNAFIISITSEFMPRLVYQLGYSEDGSLNGYINNSLSYFNTTDFPGNYSSTVQICRYRDFRNPPWMPKKYSYSEQFWHILAAKMAFVVVFENFVIVLTSLLAWLIPDMPNKIKEQIHQEAYITNSVILETELKRAREETAVGTFLLSSLNKFDHETRSQTSLDRTTMV